MATVQQLRQQAKARKIKGYSKMNKSSLMAALGVSDKSARPKGDARARATAKQHGVAKSYAADKLAGKFSAGNEAKKEIIKQRIIKSVSKELKNQEKKLGRKLSIEEKRAAAVRAIKSEATAIRGEGKLKGGSIQRASSGISAQGKPKEKKRKSANKQQQIDEKHASTNPSEDDIDAWMHDTALHQSTPSAANVKSQTIKHLANTQELNKAQRTAVKDANSYAEAVYARRKADEGQRRAATWENYSMWSSANEKDLEAARRKAANPKTKDKEKAQKVVARKEAEKQRDRETAERALKERNRRSQIPKEQQIAELKAEYEKAYNDTKKEMQSTHEAVKNGNAAKIRSVAFAHVRTLPNFDHLESATNYADYDRFHRSVIEKHLSQSALEKSVFKLPKNPTREDLKQAYRKAASKAHPDRGGSAKEFRRVQEAYQSLKQKYGY